MIPRSEYPRPTLKRNADTCTILNGQWRFRTEENDESASAAEEQLISAIDKSCEGICVPFVMESKLSGIERLSAEPACTVWYAREFNLAELSPCSRLLLHVGAADWESTVWINGAVAGSHRGGYTPFTLDITRWAKEGENKIIIRVRDDVSDPLQPSGKQCAENTNHGCFYTRCTGIWQTVWLETVPDIYITDTVCRPDCENEKVTVDVTLCGGDTDVDVCITYKGEPVSTLSGYSCNGTLSLQLPVPSPVLWDIGRGEVYDVELRAGRDCVTTYFGMRSITTDGRHVILNGRPVFMRLALDQGYYPEGIYTAPSVDCFEKDIRLMISAGFNGARMHMKVFEPGYIYAADMAGFLLWGEYPNWGLDISRSEAMASMLPEWTEAVVRDRNHPSVIGWCPFNEAFPGENEGLLSSVRSITKALDPTRLFIDSSGWIHKGCTDIYDVHDYEQDPDVMAERYRCLYKEGPFFTNAFDGDSGYDGHMPYFVSEFGGAFFDLDSIQEASAQESGGAWGYGEAPKTTEQLLDRFERLCGVLLDNPEICGFCYTQFTDVMQEMNGVFTFDRRPKMPVESMKKAIGRKAACENH